MTFSKTTYKIVFKTNNTNLVTFDSVKIFQLKKLTKYSATINKNKANLLIWKFGKHKNLQKFSKNFY